MANANYVKIGDDYYAPSHPRVKEYYASFKTNHDAQPVGGSGNQEREPNTLRALDKGQKAHRGRKARVVICVKIISIRKRESDLDNIITGAKPLRDAIAKSLGVDDGNKRIRWEYDTIVTSGSTGTQVLISRI